MPDIEKETLGMDTEEEQVTVPKEDTDFIFSVHQYDTHAQYMNTQFTLEQLIEAAQSESPFIALRDMGEKPIDGFTAATIEQSDKPFMSVDFDLDNDTVRIMNNDIIKNYQISSVNIDEITQALKFEAHSITKEEYEALLLNPTYSGDFDKNGKNGQLLAAYIQEHSDGDVCYESTIRIHEFDGRYYYAYNNGLSNPNDSNTYDIRVITEDEAKQYVTSFASNPEYNTLGRNVERHLVTIAGYEFAEIDKETVINNDNYKFGNTERNAEQEKRIQELTSSIDDITKDFDEKSVSTPAFEGSFINDEEKEVGDNKELNEFFNELDEMTADRLRDNATLNVACSLAIQTGISMMKEQFKPLELLDKVVSEYGLDRVSAVVASEIKHRMSEMPLNTNNLMNWAQGVVDKLPMQLVNELSLNIDKEQLIDFAYTVMKAEIARDNVQENDTMAELFAQLQKNQHITDNALNPEILNDRRAVEEMKLQSSLSHAKAAFERQSNTLPILKGLSEIQINKLNNLNAKQTELQNKNKFLVNKGQRLEARAERLENTSQMLKALFPNRQLPKPLQALADMTAKRAAVIRDEKIPKNNLKIDKNLRRMAKNDRKIEVAQCKVDKYQNMSKVIKSFTVLDSTERKQQFTQGLDGLHNASQRSLQLKLEKCEAKIDKLTQKYMDIETPNKPDIMAKLKAQTEKKNTLSEKIEKLGKLEKPFAEQPENVVDDVMKTAETEIEVQEEAPERMSMEDFADELCAACVDTAVAPVVEKEKVVSISKDEYDKLDLSHKGTLLAEYKYDFSDHDQSWTDFSHIYQLNDRYFSDFTSGYDGKGTFEELTADQMKSKLSDFAEKSGKDKDYSVTEAGKKLLAGKTAEKDKSADKKPSILGDIKDIKAEQSKEQKNVPEQGQKKARSNEAEI